MVRRRQQVTTRLNVEERKGLDELATEWGVSSGAILRRLILFFSKGKISILELIRRTEDMDLSQERLYTMRIALSEQERETFLSAVEGWDFSISDILRRLLRALVSGAIPENDIWKIRE